MADDDNISSEVLDKWNLLLEREMGSLPPLQLSALSSWVKDCEESFNEIYSNLLVQIASTSPDDYDTLLEVVIDLYGHLDHVKKHIIDAEDGFNALIEQLSHKA